MSVTNLTIQMHFFLQACFWVIPKIISCNPVTCHLLLHNPDFSIKECFSYSQQQFFLFGENCIDTGAGLDMMESLLVTGMITGQTAAYVYIVWIFHTILIHEVYSLLFLNSCLIQTLTFFVQLPTSEAPWIKLRNTPYACDVVCSSLAYDVCWMSSRHFTTFPVTRYCSIKQKLCPKNCLQKRKPHKKAAHQVFTHNLSPCTSHISYYDTLLPTETQLYSRKCLNIALHSKHNTSV